MQHSIRNAPGPIHAFINLPGSKSIAYRAMLLAALADGVSEISGFTIDDDITTFINALHQLGIVTQTDEKLGSVIIAGGNGRFPKKQATIWCGNNDTLARFLIAACAGTPGVYYFDGASTLRKRSILPLLKTLSLQGAQFIPSDAKKIPLTLIGADSLEGGDVSLSDARLSRMISALLMVAPYGRSPANFSFRNLIQRSRIDMTYAMMAEFGVLVHRLHYGQFMVPVPQRYQACDYLVEPNMALAAYFFAAAAITGGEVTIQPTRRCQSKQKEIKFLATLEQLGCKVTDSRQGLTVQGPAQLKGMEITLTEFCDLFLIHAAMAPFATTPTRIMHAGRLGRKELERFNAMKIELSQLGVPVEVGKNWMEIHPKMPKPGLVSTHKQYRVGMALAIIGLRVPGIIIDGAQYITKSVPDFFRLWEKLTAETPARNML